MSNLTDFGENSLADYLRGEGLALPTNWYIAPLSAAADGVLSEVTGTGIARASVARSLANFSGTQGAGSVLASSGTSKTSSNNVLIDMGTAAGASGTVSQVGFYDASSGGNCWVYAALEVPVVTANGVPIQIAINGIVLTLGSAGNMTDYLVNKLIDLLFRGQSYAYPSSTWIAAIKSDGNEVGNGVGYERLELQSTTDALSGTQSEGSTTASSGTGGVISNNAELAFVVPTGSWSDIAKAEVFDSQTSGNKLWTKSLVAAKTVGPTTPLRFAAGDFRFKFA